MWYEETYSTLPAQVKIQLFDAGRSSNELTVNLQAVEGICGDGVPSLAEECDDGNVNEFDGCHQCIQSYCGNNRYDYGEDCEIGFDGLLTFYCEAEQCEICTPTCTLQTTNQISCDNPDNPAEKYFQIFECDGISDCLNEKDEQVCCEPNPEICDNIDNDCDGFVDELSSIQEQCDYIDNDCDGTVDEGVDIEAEQCDNDNDCDGKLMRAFASYKTLISTEIVSL